MTDEEMVAKSEASSADWWARADALGVIPAADSWTALNPGVDWAANEDRVSTENRHNEITCWHAEQTERIAIGSVEAVALGWNLETGESLMPDPSAGWWITSENRTATYLAADHGYMDLVSDHTADHWVDRALNEQRDDRVDGDDVGEVDVA